jgi:N-acetylglucosamine malate deacetylase 1
MPPPPGRDPGRRNAQVIAHMQPSNLSRWQMRLMNWLLPRRAYKFFLNDWRPLDDLDRVADAMGSLRQSARLRPAIMNAPQARRIAVVAPHPDDESIGPGGTLLAAREGGANIGVVFLTDDSNETVASARRREAQAACEVLGATPAFLGFGERAIPLDAQAVHRFATSLSSLAGDGALEALFVPFLADDHEDHRRANHLLLVAAEHGEFRARPEIWAYQVYTSLPCNVLVDIGRHAGGKTQAIRSHVSQMAKRDWVSVALGLNAYNARFARGRPGGGPYEAFFVLPFEDYIDLLRRYFREPVHACYQSDWYRTGSGGA